MTNPHLPFFLPMSGGGGRGREKEEGEGRGARGRGDNTIGLGEEGKSWITGGGMARVVSAAGC